MEPLKLEGMSLLNYVLSVSRQMAGMRSLEPLLSYTVDEVLKLVGAERGYIILKQLDGTLDVKTMRDKDGNNLTGAADKISHSIFEEVVHSGSSLVLGNALTNPRFGKARSVMYLQLRSIMCAPLITRDSVIGAVYVENRAVRGRFREADVAPLELLANQAAVAIENADLIENLETLNERLRVLDDLKSNFILLVSHELRTPLTVVTTYSQLMEAVIEQNDLAALHPQLTRTKDNLRDAIQRMRQTVEEIIHVFRISSGRLKLAGQQTDLGSIVNQVTDDLAPTCADRDLTVRVQDMDELPLVMADSRQLVTVFTNIIGNAVKYTPDGGEIHVYGRSLDNAVEISIRDTGIGIPIAEQKSVFDLFHTLGSLKNHSTSKSAFGGGGFGLGLPIAKGIIEVHGGSIRLESPGHDPDTLPGTICTVTLPFNAETNDK
ncbi:MAG: HAMP domain-containing histidine kinase [Chloroflexi bacterium]|nr:HAMP domain-containing histidine kinase [Chloroflexota bacterium]